MRALARQPVALLAALCLPLLAGCLGGDGAPPVQGPAGVPPAGLEEGGYYAFRHGGGTLAFTLVGNGSADLELFGGDDVRLSRFGFGGDPGQSGGFQLEGVPAGDLVVGILTLDGLLEVRSGDDGVTRFHPLGVLVERQVLIDRPPPQDPLGGLLGPFALPLDAQALPEQSVAVAFRRAPSDLRLLLAGIADGLHVEARSERGVVLQAWANNTGSTSGPNAGTTFAPLEASLRPQAIRDGRLDVTVAAADLRGALVLEAHTYSRAPLPVPAAPGPALRDVAFTYGALPADAPVQFQVRASATALVLWQDATSAAGAQGAEALVVLHGPHDDRIAAVRVPASGTVRIPVREGGEYVAALLSGNATLGADAVPADFELHALQTRSVTLPAAVAGGPDKRYGQAEEPYDGRAYRLRATAAAASQEAPSLPTTGCDAGRRLRVEQGGEAVLVAAEADEGAQEPVAQHAAAFLLGSLALRDGPLTVVHDGFGDDGCERLAVVVEDYVRRELGAA